MKKVVSHLPLCVFGACVGMTACSEGDTDNGAFETTSALSDNADQETVRIQQHYRNRYRAEDVVHSFTTEFGDDVDCIPAEAQPLVRTGRAKLKAAPLNPVLVGDLTPSLNPEAKRAHFGFNGSDAKGRPRGCPANCVAKRRYTDAELSGFRTLDDVMNKYPPGARRRAANPPAGEIPPVLGSEDLHQYATAQQRNLAQHGGGANFEVWQPGVSGYNEFALSQLWAARGVGADLQTVEVGWQVYPAKYYRVLLGHMGQSRRVVGEHAIEVWWAWLSPNNLSVTL
jgi:hypothetical protein